VIESADFSAGTFLGNWSIPPSLGYGEVTTFDVTGFLQTVQTPYVEIIVGSASGRVDLFSGLDINYGTPEQLTIITIPEPRALILAALGLGGLVAWGWRGRKV
jgi:hypothetical protein